MLEQWRMLGLDGVWWSKMVLYAELWLLWLIKCLVVSQGRCVCVWDVFLFTWYDCDKVWDSQYCCWRFLLDRAHILCHSGFWLKKGKKLKVSSMIIISSTHSVIKVQYKVKFVWWTLKTWRGWTFDLDISPLISGSPECSQSRVWDFTPWRCDLA